jgi:hypothetical protein
LQRSEIATNEVYNRQGTAGDLSESYTLSVTKGEKMNLDAPKIVAIAPVKSGRDWVTKEDESTYEWTERWSLRESLRVEVQPMAVYLASDQLDVPFF